MAFYRDISDFLRAFERSFVGFEEVERLARMLQNSSYVDGNYPPYNIRKKSENEFVIEIAVAGFSKQDLEIELEENVLRIIGKQNKDKEREVKPDEFIFHGLASRNFIRSFTLHEQIVVKKAHLENGILKIYLERVIPEEKRKRRIEISNGTDSETKQLLYE